MINTQTLVGEDPRDNMQECLGGTAPGPDFLVPLMGRQPKG